MNDFPFRSVSEQPITSIIWDEKYRNKRADGSSGEATLDATLTRVAEGVYVHDPAHRDEGYEMMAAGYWLPGGRILAGAGTAKRVTIVNCFVNGDLPDSMVGIMEGLNVAAFTQQMGGGIGTPFGSIRPKGAIVRQTGSVSSGVLPFMDMYDAMAGTIESSGSRRAAMMATLPIWHPDVIDYIQAKHTAGRLTNFNVSVLVTDEFLAALKENQTWDLRFTVPRADGEHVDEYVRDGVKWYVYRRLQATELWETLTRSTYEFSEPGVIFIDRVNAQNPLSYCETITATNPCGEQPLPPFGNCNLGALNLAFMVKDPFSTAAEFDWDLLREVVRRGVRFLDNVLDVCKFPTEDFEVEAKAKRRLGLGYTGLANALQQLSIRYGSTDAVGFVDKLGAEIAHAAYAASVELARERGPFPEFKKEEHLLGEFVQRLDKDLQKQIEDHGLRNGVLLTIAPTGTTSLLAGNISSGLEPVFAWQYDRKVRREGGETETIEVEDFGFRLWKELVPHGDADVFAGGPMVKATELTVEEHVRMQAAAQHWIDASVSKTVNCPEEMTYAEFDHVYRLAWNLGLKGCTTYRPSEVRGSILSEKVAPEPVVQATVIELAERPEVVEGRTYKIRWTPTNDTFYVTLNNAVAPDGKIRPFEIFIIQKTQREQEWVAAMARTMSAVMRREFTHSGDIWFLPEELRNTFSARGGTWVDKKFVPSIPALLGGVLERHLRDTCDAPHTNGEAAAVEMPAIGPGGDICPGCSQPTLNHAEGCESCLSCGWSRC